LSKAAQRIYDGAGQVLDPRLEIRLLRTLIAQAGEHPEDSATMLKDLLTILARVIYIQYRSAGQVSDPEQQLLDASNSVLDLSALGQSLCAGPGRRKPPPRPTSAKR
jgi:hypothetical protein